MGYPGTPAEEILYLVHFFKVSTDKTKLHIYFILQATVQIIYDFFNIVGMKPSDLFIMLEPRELFTHISTRVGLYLPHGFFPVDAAVEKGE